MSLLVKKPLSQIMAQAEGGENGLKRTLGAANLIALGIGAIIGAGLFVRTAAAAGQAGAPGQLRLSPSRPSAKSPPPCWGGRMRGAWARSRR